MANTADPDQAAHPRAILYGFILFAKNDFKISKKKKNELPYLVVTRKLTLKCQILKNLLSQLFHIENSKTRGGGRVGQWCRVFFSARASC